MKFIRKNWHKFILLSYLVVMPIFVFAEDPPGKTGGKILNPIPNITSIPGLVHTILDGLLTIGIPVIALAIIYCGFLFVSARGKPEAITKAKDALLYTLIGAAILLGSWAIANMIADTVNLL